MAIDRTKCKDCQYRPVIYMTNANGKPVKHGFCPPCFEIRVRDAGGGCVSKTNRTSEQKENTRETKYGTGY